MRRTLTLALVFLVLLVLLAPAATWGATKASRPDDDPVATLARFVSAQCTRDWSALAAATVKSDRPDLEAFLANKDNESLAHGLFNVTLAELAEVKELAPTMAVWLVDTDRYLSQYGDARLFYTGVRYGVQREDQFHFNGVNYRLAVLVPEDGAWRLAEFSDAPTELLTHTEAAFGSPSERAAAAVAAARDRGLIMNAAGKMLGHLGTGGEKPDRGATVQHTCPSTINVYLTAYNNYHDWQGQSSPFTKAVNFYYYVKNVLPKEWYSTWPTESLKAGALACKMYGWYHVLHPKWPQYEAAVKDNTEDQVFWANSEVTSTTAAIDAMAHTGLETATSHTIFEAQHLQGSYDNSGFHSGKMNQWGTKYWADNARDYNYMCHYYYDQSPNTNYEVMGYFSY